MLTTTSDAQALIARLDTVAPAVKAALAAYLRLRRSGVAKRQAISAYAERSRPLSPPGRGRGPRREAAWEGEGMSRRARSRPSPYPLPGGERGATPLDAAALRAAAVRAALQALGRSS